MKDVFLYGVNSVVPLLLLIMLGYTLRAKKLLSKNFFDECYWFCFHLTIPCMCFNNVYKIQAFDQINWYPILYGFCMIFLFFLLGILVAQRFYPDNAQRGVVVQCFYRSNFGTMGVALAQMLGNGESSEVAALMAAGAALSFNILAVISMTLYQKEGGKKRSIKGMFLNIMKNPLVVGVTAGVVVLAVRSLIPRNVTGELVFSLQNQIGFAFSVVQNLAKISTPLILICLGGQCVLTGDALISGKTAFCVMWRNFFAPAIGIGIAAWLCRVVPQMSFNSADYAALIALFGTPMSVSAPIMVKEMNGDHVLAGQLVISTCAVSMISIFLIVITCNLFGLVGSA